MKKTLAAALLGATSLLISGAAMAHCQIPCGIYDDHARVQRLLEDAATIRKSQAMMAELVAAEDVQSRNQFSRWVMNKEQHAELIIDTISDYFLTQRVKPSQDDYAERLAKHHAVMLAAMQAKQHADERYADQLVTAIEALAPYYPAHTHD